jgi:hypothetical protein
MITRTTTHRGLARPRLPSPDRVHYQDVNCPVEVVMRRVLRALLTLAAAATLGIAGAGAANASAYGVTPLPSFSYEDPTGATRSVPYGCVLIHSVIGEGLTITAQNANVDCAGIAAMRSGLLCDVEVSFTFRPLSGSTERLDTATLPGCRTLGLKTSNAEAAQTFTTGGKLCATLTVSKKTVTTSCHVVSG